MHGFLPAKLLAMRLRRPLIYHCHDYVERNAKVSFGGRMARAFEQRFARTADLVIVPDADRAKVMKQELRLAKEPVIAANAPLSSVPRCKAVMADALAKQGKSFERIVLRQGRIGEGHAIEVTLQSIKHWKNKNWGFVLLGPSEPAYLDKIIDMARSLGVEEQFAVLPPVRYDQVALYTAGADVGHGLYEPIHINNVHITTASNKLMEYIAAGLPMLVSENPSLRSFVETHQCGLIANETSPTSIAIAVNSLLSNEEEMNRMGLAGKKIFEEIYCYERQFAPILEQIYALARRAT
jgi:glycosyltransferase involved in cell wall biosynthesis